MHLISTLALWAGYAVLTVAVVAIVVVVVKWLRDDDDAWFMQ